MNSGSSTDRTHSGRETPFQPWHFYVLVSLAGATWAVIVSPHTQPAALLLISGAIIAAGLVGAALHHALGGFFRNVPSDASPASGRTREFLEREKALILRSIKELEFDHAMRKISDADFAEIGARLRARALEVMEALDRPDSPVAGPPPGQMGTRTPDAVERGVERTLSCPACQSSNDGDARFCKNCGTKL
jgi:hypothetical protein